MPPGLLKSKAKLFSMGQEMNEKFQSMRSKININLSGCRKLHDLYHSVFSSIKWE